MARRATHLLVMAVVGISLLLGRTAGALSQEVTYERLLYADQEPNNWLMYYGNYKGWRYSPLQQINTANVQRLVVKWKFHTGSGTQNFFDASNGELCWTFNTGSGLRGSPITYAVGGKQYLAVPSGWGGVAAGGFSQAFPALAAAPRGSTLFVFGLPEE